ncbi:hypothetical protein [Xanthomonas oryzae]|uniref:hypothetical protein n=1 Tax=Xanthomonas oryzae TaxID=347 RepID=UPI001F51D538|nr:hypothetical protein [Xanthomonas oryzae]
MSHTPGSVCTLPLYLAVAVILDNDSLNFAASNALRSECSPLCLDDLSRRIAMLGLDRDTHRQPGRHAHDPALLVLLVLLARQITPAQSHPIAHAAIARSAALVVAFEGDHFDQVRLLGKILVQHGRDIVFGKVQIFLGLADRLRAATLQRLRQRGTRVVHTGERAFDMTADCLEFLPYLRRQQQQFLVLRVEHRRRADLARDLGDRALAGRSHGYLAFDIHFVHHRVRPHHARLERIGGIRHFLRARQVEHEPGRVVGIELAGIAVLIGIALDRLALQIPGGDLPAGGIVGVGDKRRADDRLIALLELEAHAQIALQQHVLGLHRRGDDADRRQDQPGCQL